MIHIYSALAVFAEMKMSKSLQKENSFDLDAILFGKPKIPPAVNFRIPKKPLPECCQAKDQALPTDGNHSNTEVNKVEVKVMPVISGNSILCY